MKYAGSATIYYLDGTEEHVETMTITDLKNLPSTVAHVIFDTKEHDCE